MRWWRSSGDRSVGVPARAWQLGQSLAASAAIQLFLFGSGILVARSLGPAGRGDLAVILILPAVSCQLAAIGVPSAITYFIAKAHRDWWPIIYGIWRVVALQMLAAVLFLWILLALFALSKPEEVVLAGALSTLALPLLLGQFYGLAILQGLGEIRQFNIFRTLPVASYTASLLVGFLSQLTVVACTVLWLLTQALTLALMSITLVRRARDRSRESRYNAVTPSEIVRFGAAGYLAQVSPIESFKVDQLVVAGLFSSSIVGFYAVAYSVSNVPRFIADGIVAVGYPHVSALSFPANREATVRYLLVGFGLCGAATVVIAVAMHWLVPLLFGPAFRPAVALGVWLVVAAGLTSVRRVGSDCLRAMGQPGASTRIEIATWAVLAVGLLLLGSAGNGRGVAAAVTVSAASGVILLLFHLYHRMSPAEDSTSAAAADSRTTADG